MDSDHEQPSSDNDQQHTTRAATRVPGKTTKGNGKVGKPNYSRDELLSLLSVMERILPTLTEEWEQVLLEHSEQYPGRDVDSIRRKYNSLHRKQVPAGDPNTPPEVLAAKRVRFKIRQRGDIGGGEIIDLETGVRRSSSETQEQDNDVRASRNEMRMAAQPVTIAPGQSPVRQPTALAQSGSSAPPAAAFTTRSSCVHCRQRKDTSQEFLELWRMQMMMDREERREERRENRKRHYDLAGVVTALVSGIATAFGVELPPATGGRKKRRQNKNRADIQDNSSDESSDCE